jgi:hypothetical protein
VEHREDDGLGREFVQHVGEVLRRGIRSTDVPRAGGVDVHVDDAVRSSQRGRHVRAGRG